MSDALTPGEMAYIQESIGMPGGPATTAEQMEAIANQLDAIEVQNRKQMEATTKHHEQSIKDGKITTQLKGIRQQMKTARGEERSERSRRIAICITGLEETIAFWQTWVEAETP